MISSLLASRKRSDNRKKQQDNGLQTADRKQTSRSAGSSRALKIRRIGHSPESLGVDTPSPGFSDSSTTTSTLPRVDRSEFISREHLNVDYEPGRLSTRICVLDDRRSRHARRKHAQADRWNKDVLPSLIRPYMKFTQGLLSPLATSANSPPTICQCGGKHRNLGVLFVSMEQLEDIVLDVCACRSATVQILERGFFPCAPVYPTLAVSLNMLEFVAALFLHIAPNERAWAATVVGYLKARGHEFATGDSLRRRFSNALAYYQVLVRLVNAEMDRIIEKDKGTIETELDESTPANARAYHNVQTQPVFGPSCPALIHPDPDATTNNPVLNNQTGPSTYLRSRCALCFGGNHADSSDMK
jgi:hypothetical protein